MAKRHLEQYDKNGNILDIYLNEEEVMVGDQTLAEKLADMEDDIGDAAQTGGEGTVTGVKVGSNTYEPTDGVVDISGAVPTSTSDLNNNSDFITKAYVDAAVQAVQTALNNLMNGQNVTDAIDTFNEVKAFLDGINSSDTLAAKLATLVPQTRTINGKPLSSNVTIGMSDIQGLVDAINNAGSGAVSVIQPDPADGTFIIRVGETDYTINLNHTHENMAKLVICEESDLPSTLDNDTIYAITDSGETEIEKLIIRGMEFAGGGVPDTGEPMISSPSNGSTINLGDNEGSGVSKTITIKGKNLTGDLTVAVGTGLTISYGQSTGQSSVTIPMAQALLGAQVTIAYSGSGTLDDGSLVISHGGSVLSSVVVVVAVQPLVFWDGADVPSNGKWIDKINNLPINLFGTANHATNGYQLNNLSDQDAASALSDAANNAFLNQEIDKEFRAIVECSIKFDATSRRALVLDFGSFGEAKSGLSANAFIFQSGEMQTTTKINGNTNPQTFKTQTGITFPVNTYVDVTIEIGARILQSGEQELYARAGNAINSRIFGTPVAVSFAGTHENSGAFALGVGYFAGDNATLNAYASTVFADVIYKSIKIYKN